MGNIERYRSRLGRVTDYGPPDEKRTPVIIADCGLHTHAEKVAHALNQHQGAVSALQQIAHHPRGGMQRNIARGELHRLGLWNADPSTTGGQ